MSAFTDLMEEVDRSIPRAPQEEDGLEKLQAEIEKITEEIVNDDKSLAGAARCAIDNPRVTVAEAVENYARALLRQRLRANRLARITGEAA